MSHDDSSRRRAFDVAHAVWRESGFLGGTEFLSKLTMAMAAYGAGEHAAISGSSEALRIAKKLGWSPPHDTEERERRIKQLENALHEACDEGHGRVESETLERLRKVATGGDS